MRRPSTRSLLLYAVTGALAFSYGWYDWSSQKLGGTLRVAYANAAFVPKYEPTFSPFYSGPEVVMIYVGRRRCAPSNALFLPQLIEDIKAEVVRRAEAGDASVRMIGVGMDWDVSDGIEHLEKFGAFDEVRAGGGAFSDAAMEYFWQTYPGVVATPQVVLIRRQRLSPPDRSAPTRYELQGAVEVERMVGLAEISNWLAGTNSDRPLKGWGSQPVTTFGVEGPGA